MQMDEVVRLSPNTRPLEWLAKAMAIESCIWWQIHRYDWPAGSPERQHAERMITAAYTACCQLDVWAYCYGRRA